MASLVKVYDDGEIGPTSCCKAPIGKESTAEGDVIYHCQGCMEQVTLVPELPEMSPAEKAAYQLAKEHNAKAWVVHESALNHVARILYGEIVEGVYEYCEEQVELIAASDISMDPVCYQTVKSFGIDVNAPNAANPLAALMLLNEKFWTDYVLPNYVDETLGRAGFRHREMAPFLSAFWTQDGGTNKIVSKVMTDV